MVSRRVAGSPEVKMVNSNDAGIEHKPLVSGASLKFGRLHLEIAAAGTKMEEACWGPAPESGILYSPEQTDFGHEVGGSEIYWWVVRRETELGRLEEETVKALDALQAILPAARRLRNAYEPSTYDDLVDTVRGFAEQFSKEIDALLEYVMWLKTRDELAPSILFTYEEWGSTRLEDRSLRHIRDASEKQMLGACVLLALGFQERTRLVRTKVIWDVSSDIADSQDPEVNSGPIIVSYDRIKGRVAREVLSNLVNRPGFDGEFSY